MFSLPKHLQPLRLQALAAKQLQDISQRTEQSATPTVLRTASVLDGLPSRVTGAPRAIYSQATIAGSKYLVNEDTPPVIRKFLRQTLSNNHYESLEQLRHRAEAYFEHANAERKMLRHTKSELDNPESKTVSQAGWMAHLERGLWNTDANFGKLDRAVLGEEAAGRAEPSAGSPFHGEKAIKLHDGNRSAMSMMLKGEEGPLTLEQTQAGFEYAQTGQSLASRMNIKDRVEFRAPNYLDADRSGTHSMKNPTGMNLSADPGTAMRDARKLPVMSGTSGTTSSAALATRFGAAQAKVSWAAPGLSEAEAKLAITDLAHHYFRAEGSSLPEALKRGINAMRTSQGLPAKEDVESSDVFTHSYSEIYSSVAFAVNGMKPDDKKALEKTIEEAAHLLRAGAHPSQT
jgi:hypothetical protein